MSSSRPPVICVYFMEDVRLPKMRVFSFCSQFRDEACCGGCDYSCVFYPDKGTGRVTPPTIIDAIGAMEGHRRH